MRIAISQLNLCVGGIDANKKKIIEQIREVGDRADLLVFPELALSGYPPDDLLLRPAFHRSIEKSLHEIVSESRYCRVILGYPENDGGSLYNSCSLISSNGIEITYRKRELPNYGVFDEKRYFKPGNQTTVINLDSIPTALSICEDIWVPDPAGDAAAAGARLLININASPYHVTKQAEREEVLRKRTGETGLDIIYLNLVGGQDEVVFDGGSMVISGDGSYIHRYPQFEEGLYFIETEYSEGRLRFDSGSDSEPLLSREEEVYHALVLGVRDYVRKNGFNGAVIGLSGGIDSALTLAIAVDALGSENVEVLLMPSRYTAGMSVDDSVAMAQKLGVASHIVPIDEPFSAFTRVLDPVFSGLTQDVTEENIQARCRGILLMAVSNKKGKIVLTTGNKSEMAVGYATLYGDMAGGFAPLKDVSKLLVYALSRWRNRRGQIIPQRIIDRPPSAELRPDQKDEDSLPPYDILDPILERYIELDQSPEQITGAGFDGKIVHEVIRLVDRNEYKRRQAAPGVKISKRAFGRDRRYPITSGYRE